MEKALPGKDKTTHPRLLRWKMDRTRTTKILSAYPAYRVNREDIFEGPFKRLLNATELKGPSGFLRLRIRSP